MRLFATGMLAGLLVLLSASNVLAQEAAIRIGVVDLQAALLEVEDGRRAKAQIEQEYERRATQIQAKEEAITRMQQEIEAQSMMVDPAVQEQRQAELQAAFLEYQQLGMESQQQMAQLEQTLTADIISRMIEVAGEVGRSQGYTIVLERSAVVYMPDSYDITAAIVQAYNSR